MKRCKHVWWESQEDTVMTKHTTRRPLCISFLLTRTSPCKTPWDYSLPVNSDPISPLSFSPAFRARKHPSAQCGDHCRHRDWAPASADTGGCPGMFHFPSQVQWHSQILLLPPGDPSPRGRTLHPPILGLDLQDLPTAP